MEDAARDVEGRRDTASYYPEGHHPELLEEWPVESDFVVNLENLPPALRKNMGGNWRDRKAYQKHISQLTADDGSDE